MTWIYQLQYKLEDKICRQIQNLHASFGINERKKDRLRLFAKLHIIKLCSLAKRVEIQGFFPLRAAFSEILAVFHNCHIWAWNLAIGKSSRSCTYILFLSRWVEIELIVAEIRADFSKLPYLDMKLGHWQKFQKLHIHSLSSTTWRRNWAYFRSTGSSIQVRAFFTFN